MEKNKPTYDLEAIKAGADDPDRLEMTTTALLGALALGFDRERIVATIRSMARKHFYKSMTSHHNHRIWQDVYHVPSDAGLLYVKFSSGYIAAFTLVSFKEK